MVNNRKSHCLNYFIFQAVKGSGLQNTINFTFLALARLGLNIFLSKPHLTIAQESLPVTP